MKKCFIAFTFLSTIFSCQKHLDKESIYGTHIESSATLADRVYAVKNTGIYSDTSSIARKGYGIVFNGNSILERMNYSNWTLTWVSKGYPVLNRAIGGTTWNEKIPYIKDLTTTYRPNDIVLYDGENEFLRAAATDTTVATKLIASFNRTIDSIRANNRSARIYIVSMVTCPVLQKKGFASAITRVNEAYQARVNRDAVLYPGKMQFVDIRSYYPPTASTKFEADSIHIKLAAYTEFYNALKTALPKPGTGAWDVPPAQPATIEDTIPAKDTTIIAPSPDTIPRTDTLPVITDTLPKTDTIIKPADTVIIQQPAPGNMAPIANAGADIVIGKSWNYNPWVYGTQSKDPDGWIAAFKWTCIKGVQYTIVSPSSGKTRLDNLAVGVYVFRLIVTDNKGAQAFDDVQVTVTK